MKLIEIQNMMNIMEHQQVGFIIFLIRKQDQEPKKNAFIKIVNKSNRKLNKLWVDQEREFYSKITQEWLDSNDS